MIYLILTAFFFLIMLLYFKVADYYNIIDKPNERSSHNRIVIRGGGIVFFFANLAAFFLFPQFSLLLSAIALIGVISFLDDVFCLSDKVRILFHLASVTMVFYYFNIFQFPIYWIVGFYILVIGVINAYNFMDGINGITGLYTLVVLAGLQYVNQKQFNFIDPGMIWLLMIACAVFLYFNFRTNAKCFAGDIGSVTIALWIIILLMQLILFTHNLIYILFLSVYGVDSVLTIIHRLFLKHNIFKAHRLHFYQLLVNECKWPHLWVAALYAFMQLCIIVLIIFSTVNSTLILLISCVPLILLYISFKPVLMKLRTNPC